MSVSKDFSLDQYIKDAAIFLRKYEAERLRGNIAQLEDLENTSDIALVRKWAWISAICGALFSFLAMPLLLGLVQSLLPFMLTQFLWAFVKVSMGMSLLMFAAAIYFTIGMSSER